MYSCSLDWGSDLLGGGFLGSLLGAWGLLGGGLLDTLGGSLLSVLLGTSLLGSFLGSLLGGGVFLSLDFLWCRCSSLCYEGNTS